MAVPLQEISLRREATYGDPPIRHKCLKAFRSRMSNFTRPGLLDDAANPLASPLASPAAGPLASPLASPAANPLAVP